MGAPKGSKNALGNKGGGRKSAYQEMADARLLNEMFFTAKGKGAVSNKMKSGKYSLKDVFVSKGYAGNDRVLLALFNKLFPDKNMTDLTSGGEKLPTPILGGLTQASAVQTNNSVKEDTNS